MTRILLLRTAQLPEVQWAREALARRYPDASFAVLGTRLKALGLFEDCVRFELPDGKITPRTVRPFRRAIAAFAPDLVVMCLNTNGVVGYEQISRVVKGIPAQNKLVAGYDHTLSGWRHEDFSTSRPIRCLVDALGTLLLVPAAFVYLLAKSSRPTYKS